jgi:hypothetical protein
VMFVAAHSTFTWKPRLCRWPGPGWSIWWLWFEVASVRRREHCQCFGDSGLCASTFRDAVTGLECCDFCGKPVQ